MDDYITFATINCCENRKERREYIMISSLLCSIASWSWIVENTLPSVILFGEYPYPADDAN